MPDEDLAATRVETEDDQVNVLGDQDALNTSGYQYPADAHIPTAQNVRRYPELFNEDVIASFNVPDANDELEVDPDAEVLADDSAVKPATPTGEPLDATTVEGAGSSTSGDAPDSRVTFP